MKDEIFFDVRHQSGAPIIRLHRQGEKVIVSETSDKAKPTPIMMDSPSGRFQPIAIEGHREFSEDLAPRRHKLSELFGRWDLIEPFDRLAKALD